MTADESEPEATFGTELRRLRQAKGKSLARLADELRTSKGYLSRLENGHQRPSAQFARACDVALNAGGALGALAGPVPDVCPYPGLTSFRGKTRAGSSDASEQLLTCWVCSPNPARPGTRR